MNHRTIQTLDEIRRRRKPIRNANIAHRENLSRLERLALTITRRVGTMGFFLIILTWTVAWLAWNLLSPVELRFDPFPAFVFWLFISNTIQLLLTPLLMVGQNLQGKHAEARAEADFDVNVQSEREIETVLAHLELQNELILEIINQLKPRETKRKK